MFSEAISSGATPAEISNLADKLLAQRLAPLEKHLQGVQRLFVVSVNKMAGVPVDALTDEYVVSYVPSGTYLARTEDRPRPQSTSLLALGDAVYPAAATTSEARPLLTVRASGWAELPGTSVEVARLRSLVGDDHTTALTRSDASEQSLEQLHAAGKLKDFRYLHFATHGDPNNARAFESALILAQDQITGEIPKEGGKYYDGRLTANEVLENWELNADLVTLSACESALGRPGGGDGLLGFAQAFLLAGARSVCLSLWKVDDTATALLMDRFYQNLLGKREGLDQPMPKAEALTEAKRWLRSLTAKEVKDLTQDISAGVARGKGETAIPVTLDIPEPQVDSADNDHPFSHPRYWAAFVLIGDPE
jgi:CHAT domain-containing protein